MSTWSSYVHEDGSITIFHTSERRQRAGTVIPAPVDGWPFVFQGLMPSPLHGNDYVIGAYATVREAISDMMWMYDNLWIALSDGATAEVDK